MLLTAVVAVKVKSPAVEFGLWALPTAVEPAFTLNVPESEPYFFALTTTDLTLAAEDKVSVIEPLALPEPIFTQVVPAYTFEPEYDDIPDAEFTNSLIEEDLSVVPSEFASLNVTDATVLVAIVARCGALPEDSVLA